MCTSLIIIIVYVSTGAVQQTCKIARYVVADELSLDVLWSDVLSGYRIYRVFRKAALLLTSLYAVPAAATAADTAAIGRRVAAASIVDGVEVVAEIEALCLVALRAQVAALAVAVVVG